MIFYRLYIIYSDLNHLLQQVFFIFNFYQMNQLRSRIRNDEKRNKQITQWWQSKEISEEEVAALFKETEKTTQKLSDEIDVLLKKKNRTEDNKEKVNDIIITLESAWYIGEEWTEKIIKLQEKLINKNK